jgi:hypothetical protein
MAARSWGPRCASGRRSTSSYRREPSTICAPCAPSGRLQDAHGFARREPGLRRAPVIDAHGDLRDQHLLFDAQVDQAGHRSQAAAKLFGQGT